MSLARKPEVISLDPQLLGDIVENIRMLGRATGAEDKAENIAADMEARIEAVAQRAADADSKPSVLHVEWADPLMCGGHWVPEMVDLAGGSNSFGDKDTGTFKIEWDEVLERQPDIIVMMPCGFDVKRRPRGRAHPRPARGVEGPARRPQRPGVRGGRQRLYQPFRPALGQGPGNHGRDDSPGAVQRQHPGAGGAAAVQRLIGDGISELVSHRAGELFPRRIFPDSCGLCQTDSPLLPVSRNLLRSPP